MLTSTLLKLSLTISILGTFTILLISEFSEKELQKINELSKDQLETRVKISAKIISIRETPGLYILRVTDDTATIPVIIFKEDALQLKTNQQIEIIGKLTEYNNELEIIAETIKE